MIFLFIIAKRKFSLICFDLLPKTHDPRRLLPVLCFSPCVPMADSLHQSLKSMSPGDEEELLTLLGKPKFRVFDENTTSMLERLLNRISSQCQRWLSTCQQNGMCMGEYMVFLSLKISSSSYCSVKKTFRLSLMTYLSPMALVCWTLDLPKDILRYMDVWIRIRHIPINFFTLALCMLWPRRRAQ